MLEKIDSTNKIKVEPYWNVNLKNELTALNKSLIKVEPYWNVNLGKEIYDMDILYH